MAHISYYGQLGGKLFVDDVDGTGGNEEEEEEEDDEEEGYHLPRPPVQEVCPGDHLQEKLSLQNSQQSHLLFITVGKSTEDDQHSNHHKYES